MEQDGNWKRKLLLAGAAIGAALGIGTAYLMIRTAEENENGQAPQINTSDLFRTTVGIIGAMRGIAALGKKQ